MKKILAAIDFSECSLNALHHAIDLAKKHEADLTMVWVNPETFKFITDSNRVDEDISNARSVFEGLWKQYHSELPRNEFRYLIKKGQIYEQIVKAAIEEDADIIIAGTHGVSGFREFWMGSNAFRLIMASTVPVLTVREKSGIGTSLQRIVLPIDSTLETRQKNEITASFAKVFDAEVHVLALYTSSIDDMKRIVDSYAKETIKYLQDSGVKCALVEREGSNITNMTLDYAHEVDANLIVIMTEQEIKTVNLWMGTYARQMINHSKIPVLSVKPKEFIKSGAL